MADLTLPETEVIQIAQQAAELKNLTRGELYFDSARGVIVDTDKYADQPKRMKGETVLHTVDAFMGFLETVAIAGQPPRVYLDANVNDPSYIAVIDHYNGEPEWQDWRAKLIFRKTPQWLVWTKAEGQKFGQMEFAEFIEDNRLDIRRPDSADLLEIVKTMQVNNDKKFKQGVRLESGEVRFTSDDNITARAGSDGSMVIPTDFDLGIAPFEGGDPFKITARIRWRLSEAEGLKFHYRLERTADVVKKVIDEASEKIAEKYTIFNGVPSGAPSRY